MKKAMFAVSLALVTILVISQGNRLLAPEEEIARVEDEVERAEKLTVKGCLMKSEKKGMPLFRWGGGWASLLSPQMILSRDGNYIFIAQAGVLYKVHAGEMRLLNKVRYLQHEDLMLPKDLYVGGQKATAFHTSTRNKF